MTQRPSRPIGITILAVLEILIGTAGLLASLAIIGLSALVSTLPTIGGLIRSIGLIIVGVSFFFSLVWLATGVGFIHGRGWSWTLGMIFSLLCVLGAVGALAIGLISGGVVGILFWGLMVYYLTRSHVKVFFGKAGLSINPSFQIPYSPQSQFNQLQTIGTLQYGQPAPTNPSTTQTRATPASPTPTLQTANGTLNTAASNGGPKAIVSCPYCGSKLTMGSPKCMTCGAII